MSTTIAPAIHLPPPKEKLSPARCEDAARQYFLELCWPGGEKACPKCDGAKVYTLADARYRCGGCRYTFHDLSRRWINVGGLSCQQWYNLLTLFAQELTVSRMAPELELSYNTVYRAATTLRFAILAQALDAGQLLAGAFGRDLGFENGRVSMDKTKERLGAFPVFGIMEKAGRVFVDLLPYLQAENVFHFHLNFQLKLVRMGNVVYTDRYRQYDALIFCGDETVPFGFIQPKNRMAQVDTQKEGFWPFAKARLKRFNGITPRRFPLYLKELEFRYNHRQQDILPPLSHALCQLVPNYE